MSELPLVEHFFRREHGRLLASLVRHLGPSHLQLAEEAVGEAFARAVRTWPLRGVPERPGSWLYVAARNYAIDCLRRERFLQERLPELVAEQASRPEGGGEGEGDDQLALIFMCCHPALARKDQVALTLKAVVGLGTDQIAASFLLQESAIAQRLVRAKRRLQEAGAEFAVPEREELPERLEPILDVLYLVFNEGHQAHSGDTPIRAELVDEALRLGRLLATGAETGRPVVHALLAQMLLSSARFPARLNDEGAFVPLPEQDRSLWDRGRLTLGLGHLAQAGRGQELSSFHLQAGIEACHAVAPTFADTDWRRILSLYDDLLHLTPTPVVRLNRLVALSFVNGPDAGLGALDELEGADDRLRAVTRADLLRRLGRLVEARSAYEEALVLAVSEAERLFYRRRLTECAG